MNLLDLPLELLPLILQQLVSSDHLASCCLVNKSFYTFAVPKLYESAFIFSWQKNGKTKVLQLFITLARHPRLAEHVRRLEIRDFPKATSKNINISEIVVQGIRNCVNLKACSWTRDGSLTSPVLKALESCRTLRDLTINGHHDGYYDPQILLQLNKLTSLSIVMPSGPVAETLVPWMNCTGETLTSLTLICKSSPMITDTLLEKLAPSLLNLEHLSITGCTKVTHMGIWAMISANLKGLHGLGLEGLSSRFDMAELSRLCVHTHALSQLRFITITVHQQTVFHDWMSDVRNLLVYSPLQHFQVYSTGAVFEAAMTDEFWQGIIDDHGERLTRFSVHRMLLSLDTIENVCRRCVKLEELFVVVEQSALGHLSNYLSHARKLRMIHINYPLEAHTAMVPVLSPTDALSIIQHCSSTVTQFGCNTRVWRVDRIVTRRPQDGRIDIEAKLSSYEGQGIPEPFLVVRA